MMMMMMSKATLWVLVDHQEREQHHGQWCYITVRALFMLSAPLSWNK